MSGKKKIIRLHRVISLLVAIGLTVVIAVALFQRSGLLSYRLSSYVNDHYLKGTPFHFSCGKISGDLVGNVSLADPVLRFRDGRVVAEVFRAERISLEYSLLQVLKLKMIVRNLELENVAIRVFTDAEGQPVLPTAPSSTGASTVDALPHVEINRFAIRGLDVVYEQPNNVTRASDLNVEGSVRYIKGIGEFDIDSGSANLPDNELALSELTASGSFGRDGIALDDLQARTDLSFVRFSGRYQNGRFHHVQGVFNPLDLRDVSALGILDERGELGGNVVVEGTVDSLAIRGSVTGRAIGLVFSGLTLEGLVTRPEIHLTNVAGEIFGSRLNGDVTYNLDNGVYSFQGVCEGVDISQGFIGGDVPETDLNGFIHLRYDAPRETYEVRGDLRRSTIEGFESDEVQARLSYNEKQGLAIRSATLSRDGFVLNGSGTLDADGQAELILALEGDSLDYIMDYISLPRIGGHADLKGRLKGPLDRFQLNLNGTWNDLEYILGTIDSSRVYAEAKQVGSDDVEATINIDGRNLLLGDRRFDKPHLLIRANTDEVMVRDFSFAKGDTFITSDFQVLPGEVERDILIKHLVVRMPHSDWVNERPARMVVDDYTARLDTLVLGSIGRRVAVVGEYGFENRTLNLDGWGRSIDLQLIREAMDLPFPLDGVGEFTTHIYGDVDNPMIDLTLALGHGQVDSLEFDRLRLDGGFNDDGYYVDEFVVADRQDSLRLNGSWGYNDSPFNILRHGVERERAEDAPVRIEIDGYRYPLRALFRIARQKPYWGGALDGSATIGNTLGQPEVRVSGSLVSRPEDRYQLPPVSTDIEYANDALQIHNFSFDDGSTNGRMTGAIDMQLGLTTGLVFTGDSPIDVDIVLSSKDLSAVAGYFRAISVSGGGLEGELTITGTADNPRYSGTLELEDGVLKLHGMEEIYRKLRTSLAFDGKDVRLVSLSGEVGKGRFSANGGAQIDRFRLESYDVNVDLTDYTLTSIRDFESTQGGRVRLRSQPGSEGHPIPLITGKVNVKQAVVTRPIGREDGPPSTLGLPTESPKWMVNLDIEAPKNVWMRNPDLNMELGGDLIMKRDTSGLYFRGDLGVLRGSYTLYNNKFRITAGRIDFSKATTLRPDINLSAYTPHRVSGQQERRIFLDLNWPYDKKEPEISLSYDAPGYSETDLWKMLGGQVVTGDPNLGGTGALGAATGTATNLASNYLERILNAQMRDVTVEVESRPLSGTNGGTGERELTIAVGRYLSEDLYLKYQQGLTVTSAREVDIEYRISNLFLLRSEIIKHQGPRAIAGGSRQTTDEINFDIKFRIEY